MSSTISLPCGTKDVDEIQKQIQRKQNIPTQNSENMFNTFLLFYWVHANIMIKKHLAQKINVISAEHF